MPRRISPGMEAIDNPGSEPRGRIIERGGERTRLRGLYCRVGPVFHEMPFGRLEVFALDVAQSRFVGSGMPADVREMHRDHGLGKLDRHALRNGAAAITARDDELPVSQYLGHEPMQQARGTFDARNLLCRLQHPGESEAWQ